MSLADDLLNGLLDVTREAVFSLVAKNERLQQRVAYLEKDAEELKREALKPAQDVENLKTLAHQAEQLAQKHENENFELTERVRFLENELRNAVPNKAPQSKPDDEVLQKRLVDLGYIAGDDEAERRRQETG